MTFKPGDPKPPNSGMTKGKKTRKTIARETAHMHVMSKVKQLAPQLRDMTAAEVMEHLEFNPALYLVLMLEEPGLDWMTRLKAVEMLYKSVYPQVKAMEITGEQTNEVRVVFGMPQDQQTIDAQPSNRLFDGTQTSLGPTVEAIIEDDEADDAESDEDRS